MKKLAAPLFLYHGTSAEYLPSILEHGLQPRGEKPSQWENAPSRSDLVYLTDNAYAVHFARQASKDDHPYLVVEVSVKKLVQSLFLPDEDFLEQGTRPHLETNFPKLVGMTMEKRTEWFRNNLELYQDTWKASIEHLGTCAYNGAIPRKAINRAITIEGKHELMWQCIDPTITLLNRRIMGWQYKTLIRWLMGDTLTAKDLMWPGEMELMDEKFSKQRIKGLNEMLANREGWKRVI